MTDTCEPCVRRYLQFVLYGHTDDVSSVSMTEALTFAITTSRDNTACIWRLEDGQLYARLVGHTDDVLKARFTPDSLKVVTGSKDNSVRIWTFEGVPIATCLGHTDDILFLDVTSRFIVSTSEDNTARLWGFDGQPIARMTGHTDDVLAACISDNGQHLVTCGKDDRACVYSVNCPSLQKRGSVLKPLGKRWGQIQDSTPAKTHALRGHTDDVLDAKISRDGKHIVTASEDNTVMPPGPTPRSTAY